MVSAGSADAIPRLAARGGREGETMHAFIHFRASDRWNTWFIGKAVRCGNAVELGGGMKLTLLRPGAELLGDLRDDWKRSCWLKRGRGPFRRPGKTGIIVKL